MTSFAVSYLENAFIGLGPIILKIISELKDETVIQNNSVFNSCIQINVTQNLLSVSKSKFTIFIGTCNVKD